MTTNIEIKRGHDGKMSLFVSGFPALNAKVTTITDVGDHGLSAVVVIPTKHVTFSEVESVIPFEPRRKKAA